MPDKIMPDKIIHDIRNMRYLTQEQLAEIKNMTDKQKMEIINIYGINIIYKLSKPSLF